MKIKDAKFMISAVRKEQYPSGDVPEIAFVGRSNVGKSSLLNALTNKKALAKVGKTPGVTALVNFFSLDDKLTFVDLPGYGYAATAKKERDSWGEIISTYLNTRKQLNLIVMIVDIRHEPSNDDKTMYEWIRFTAKNHIIIASKADKIGKSQLKQQSQLIRNSLAVPMNIPIIPVSSTNKVGLEDVWNAIDNSIVN